MVEFKSALEILRERYEFEIGYITREIEKTEKERAFLLKKRYQYEKVLQDCKEMLQDVRKIKGSSHNP